MKDKISLFFLFLAISFKIFGAGDMKVVTMNIHCFKNNWKYRLDKILDEMIKVSPDIISFQEVCIGNDSQFDFIKKNLRSKGFLLAQSYLQYTHRAWDSYDEYIATFTKHRPSDVRQGFLPQSPLMRGFLGLKIGGTWYINIHLEHRRDYAPYRKKQIEFLIDLFQNDSHLILGDYNSTPRTVEQKSLSENDYKAYFPGKTHIGDGGQDFFDIDGFWMSSKLKSQVKNVNASIFLNELVNGKYLSDHFAVLLKFKFL